jgi:hypothetical protein
LRIGLGQLVDVPRGPVLQLRTDSHGDLLDLAPAELLDVLVGCAPAHGHADRPRLDGVGTPHTTITLSGGSSRRAVSRKVGRIGDRGEIDRESPQDGRKGAISTEGMFRGAADRRRTLASPRVAGPANVTPVRAQSSPFRLGLRLILHLVKGSRDAAQVPVTVAAEAFGDRRQQDGSLRRGLL